MKRHLMPETRVKRVGEAAVTGEDGWTFAPPAEHMHRFEPGLEYALETRGLSVVTGCRIYGDRIEFFRDQAGERFESDGLEYELVVAELAVLYDASGLAESDAVNGYGREYGTSGNQHGIARLLAGARRNDPEWSAAGSVSALSPITGEPFYVKEPK